MLCLCGKRTDAFWCCAQDPGCGFSCPEDEAWIYDRGVKKFLATKQDRPKCCGVTPEASAERNYARFNVACNLTKPYFGLPFFTCSKDHCDYFAWGDKGIIEVPLCHHGKPCRSEKVRKEGPNKGRWFLCCPDYGKKKCDFFQWFETSDSRKSNGKKVDDEFRWLDEENPFYVSHSSSFERERQKCLDRVESNGRVVDEDGFDVMFDTVW